MYIIPSITQTNKKNTYALNKFHTSIFALIQLAVSQYRTQNKITQYNTYLYYGLYTTILTLVINFA